MNFEFLSSIFSDKEGLMRHHRQVKLAKAWLICKMLFPSFATMQGIRKKEAAACGIMLTLFATFSSTKVFATSVRVEELSSSIFQSFSRLETKEQGSPPSLKWILNNPLSKHLDLPPENCQLISKVAENQRRKFFVSLPTFH